MTKRDQAVYIISVAAELAGVHPQTLRIYERRGLLEPYRTPGGTRRYSDEDRKRLPATKTTQVGLTFLTVRTPDQARPGRDRSRRYLWISSPMPEAGWNVAILADTQAIPQQVRFALAVAGFMLVSLILTAANIYQRGRKLVDRLAFQDAARAELEEKVHARTLDLDEANAQLRAEIIERQKTEGELRRTQADLIQASKLAAMGQMAAGLSH